MERKTKMFVNILNKIRNGQRLTKMEKDLLEDRMFTESEIKVKNPAGVVLVQKNKEVEVWKEKMTSKVMTVHKSQGTSIENVIYIYDEDHHHDTVYVALSGAKSLENVFLVPRDGQKVFHHGKQF